MSLRTFPPLREGLAALSYCLKTVLERFKACLEPLHSNTSIARSAFSLFLLSLADMLKPLRRSARLLKKREKLPLQLPLEVLELILEYSLPPCPPLIANISATSTTNRPLASWFIFPLRSEQLCAIALVSRQCRRWAQRELLRHIVLDSDEAVDRLLEAWEPLSVEERASRGIVTETLRIGHDDEDEPIRLGDRFE